MLRLVFRYCSRFFFTRPFFGGDVDILSSMQEKVYNPYYALVAQKFCGHGHGFKITLQFALWDAVKAMGADASGGEEEAMDVRKVSHYARLYAYLIGTESLTLGVLKVRVEFEVQGQRFRISP